MHWQYTPYVIPVIVPALIAVIVAAVAWRRRSAPGAVSLMLLMVAVAIWCIAYALRLGSMDLETKMLWARVRYLGIVLTPMTWLTFVLEYTGRGQWLSRRNVALLLIEPVITLLLVWTNGSFHTLFWRDVRLVDYGAFVGWHADYGVAYAVHGIYSYALFGMSIWLLVRAFFRCPRPFRRQIGILLAGALVSIFGNVLSVFRFSPIAFLDITPFAFAFGGLIVAWGIFRLHLMDLIPVAYDAVLEGIEDGVIVLGYDNRIVNLNPAACQILGCQVPEMMGRLLEELLERWPDLLGGADHIQQTRTEIVLGEGAGQRYYDLQISPLHQRSRDIVGWCIVLHDITMRIQAEHALRVQKQLYQNLTAVARVTAENLSLDSTLQNTLDVAAAVSGAESGGLFIVDDAFSVTHNIFTYKSPRPKYEGHILKYILERGLSGWVARNRQSALVYDVRQDDRWVEVSALGDTRSALSVPIMGKESLLGVVTLVHSDVGHFTKEHLALMEASAEQMALAWHNAQIYEEQLRLANRLTTLYEVLRTIGGSLNPKTLPHMAVEVIARLTRWPAVAILVPDASGESLVIQAASSLIAVSHGWRLSATSGSRGQVFQTGETLYVPDASGTMDAIRTELTPRSQLIVPLRRGDRVLGVLDIESDQPDAFVAEDRTLAELLAEAIALSLDVAQSHAEIGGYVADLSALYAVSRTTSRSLVLEELLAQTLNAVLVSIGFDIGLISLADRENGHLYVAAEAELAPQTAASFNRERLTEILAAHAYVVGKPVVISDIEQRDDVSLQQVLAALPDAAAQLRAVGVRAYVGVPLLHRERVIGVLSLLSRPPKPSLAHDIALLMAVGRQIATAVVNAQLFRAVEEERGRLQALIESSRDAIFFIGMDLRINFVNTQALELMQFPESPEYWKNRYLLDAIAALRHTAPEVVRLILSEMRRLRDDPTGMGRGELDMPPRVLQWLHTPVIRGDTPLGYLVLLRDVTEERLLERRQNDLTHTMVHDLRNPLTGIWVAIQLLERSFSEGDLSTRQKQMLEILDDSTQRMLSLVNAILDIGRLESGRMPIEYEEIPLDELVADVLDSQTHLAAEKNLRLESALLTEAPIALADPSLIDRVLQNLVGNAIKFTENEGVVKVTIGRETADSPRYLITVQDTGTGIPLDVQGHLFQKFVTGDQVGRGSGLGLAFCKMVLEAHGERMWLADTSEKGTTFCFTLSPPPPETE